MKSLKMMGLVSLVLGFLWLGVPRCEAVDYLEKQDRQQVEYLCRMVLLEHFLAAKPESLTVMEWKAVLKEYRAAAALDDRDLATANPTFPDHGGKVIERLAARLRGR